MLSTLMQASRRRARVRSHLSGTALRPRLTVHITNRHITAQLIDDDKGVTLGYATSVKGNLQGTMTERSAAIGTQIAEVARKHKINQVVFDRAGRLYHGRLHALAEAARAAGLEF